MRLNRHLNEELTYWSPAGEDKYGNVSYGTPILLNGRWEEKAVEVTTSSGDTIVSNAVIYVDRDIATKGFLAQGDYTEVADPTFVAAQEIKQVHVIPDLRNVGKERRAYV